MRKISYLGWGLVLFALILSGCGKLERKGTAPVNIPPQVFFANVPPESLKFSVNPRIYWYATDRDGYITAYQYAVIVDSLSAVWGGLEAAKDSLEKIGVDSANWVNITARMNIFGAHVAAEKGHQKIVRMYAAMNPEDSMAQHIFLRALDNHDGVSEIKNRMYWRSNHPPQCFIDVDSTFVDSSFYCLTETTQTWKGIPINWHGSDTLDYTDKRKQPDLYFKWELRGPYVDTLHLDDPVATLVDSSLDSLEIEGEWIYDRWQMNKSYVFKNLENYDKLGYGWYQLKVWSRDDAFVSSEKPRTAFFRILKPLFRYGDSSRKTVLVLDATIYKGDGRPSDTQEAWPFYQALLSSSDICNDFKMDSLGGGVPREDLLSQYDLVIVLNLAQSGGILENIYIKLRNYLNVGGRLWIIGMNNFGLTGSREKRCLGDPAKGIQRAAPTTYRVATEYLGVDCAFYPGYSPSFLDRLEFIAAEPFGSWGFPPLEMDSLKATKLEGYKSYDPGLNFAVYGIPHVCYDVLSALDFAERPALKRRLYSFISRRGASSELDHMPCATTYIGSTFRTAEFTFPLNLMKDGDQLHPGAQEAFRKMVKWFWEDWPLP